MIFGHASPEKLNELPKIFPFVIVSKSNIPCDVCFYAKKKMISFPS
jgi:hypothetical protein